MIDPDGMQPSNGIQPGLMSNVTITDSRSGLPGAGSSSGLLGGALAGTGIVLQGIQAWNAFSFKAPTVQDWRNALRRIQQNKTVRQVWNDVNDFAGGFFNASLSDVSGVNAPMSSHTSRTIYNFGRKAGHVAALFGSVEEIEGGGTAAAAGLAGTPATFGASLTLTAAGGAIIVHGTFTLTNSVINLITGNGEDPGEPEDITPKEAPKELPIQTHHFATNKHSFFTPRMKEIADRFGLNLDEAWNKAKLPHLGRHPDLYHNFVLNNMKRAAAEAGGSRIKFLELFDEYVIKPIQQNPNLLRKSGW